MSPCEKADVFEDLVVPIVNLAILRDSVRAEHTLYTSKAAERTWTSPLGV